MKTNKLLWTVQSKNCGVHAVWTDVNVAVAHARWLQRNWDDQVYYVKSLQEPEVTAEGWAHFQFMTDKHWFHIGHADMNAYGFTEDCDCHGKAA